MVEVPQSTETEVLALVAGLPAQAPGEGLYVGTLDEVRAQFQHGRFQAFLVRVLADDYKGPVSIKISTQALISPQSPNFLRKVYLALVSAASGDCPLPALLACVQTGKLAVTVSTQYGDVTLSKGNLGPGSLELTIVPPPPVFPNV